MQLLSNSLMLVDEYHVTYIGYFTTDLQQYSRANGLVWSIETVNNLYSRVIIKIIGEYNQINVYLGIIKLKVC